MIFFTGLVFGLLFGWAITYLHFERRIKKAYIKYVIKDQKVSIKDDEKLFQEFKNNTKGLVTFHKEDD